MLDQRWLRFSALTLLITLADLGTKVWASAELGGSGIDLPGPLDLRLSHNAGIAFGAFDGVPPILIVLLTAAVAATVFVAGGQGSAPFLACALIAGGAIGNVLDRLQAGSVVDMLHTSFWPTFNLADVFITSGAALWCLSATARRDPSDRHLQAE